MITINKGNYSFSVDIEKTKKYYETHSLCQCFGCENFYRQAKKKFPKLDEFLAAMGTNISRPDKIVWYEGENEISYDFAAYTVCGNIIKSGDKIEIQDGQFISVIADNSYIPNEQDSDDYFVITVYGITLPWVLDEPFKKS